MDRAGTLAPEAEAAIVARVAGHSVPVPAVVHVLGEADGLGRGFVMTRMPGEALGRRIVADPRFDTVRPRLTGACGTILARLHAIGGAADEPLARRTAAAALAALADQLRRAARPSPIFTAALRHLRASCPADRVDDLVHGDFRTGNFLLEAGGVTAVLDWEAAHRGDGHADLGWLCMPVWRFGRLDRPVGGFGTRAALYSAYEAAGGTADPPRARWWELFGMLRWGLTCTAMADAVRAGERSLERAAVGRRAVEAEAELFHALTGGAD